MLFLLLLNITRNLNTLVNTKIVLTYVKYRLIRKSVFDHYNIYKIGLSIK